MKLLAVIALATTLAVPAFAQHHSTSHPAEGLAPIHNGIWWNSKSHEYHDGYLVGYKNGDSHAVGHKGALDGFPAAEIIEGLDKFYGDFRNKNILVDDGIVYVQHQLSGVDDKTLGDEILKLRAASRPAPTESE